LNLELQAGTISVKKKMRLEANCNLDVAFGFKQTKIGDAFLKHGKIIKEKRSDSTMYIRNLEQISGEFKRRFLQLGGIECDRTIYVSPFDALDVTFVAKANKFHLRSKC
jgi:hypothetical protein